MTPDEIRQLLGGYASGTLSDSEKKLLFEAALEDQVLFDAMADEQALKDLLDDPESRGYLQAVLDEAGGPDAVQPDRIISIKAVRSVAPVPAAPPVMVAPAREVSQIAAAPPSRKVPAMWWGLLAAAALAVVSVVGILRFDRRPSTIEVAEAKKAPAPVSQPSKEKEVQKSAEPPKPAAAVTTKAPRPATPPAPPPAQAENPSLDKLKQPAAEPAPSKTVELAKPQGQPVPSQVPSKDEGTLEGGKRGASNAAATRPAVAAPAAAAPPPPPAVEPDLQRQSKQQEHQQTQQQNGIAAPPATVATNAQQAPRDQAQVVREDPQQVPAPSAREQYFSADQAAVDAKAAQSEQAKSAKKEVRKANPSRGAGAVSAGRIAGASSSVGGTAAAGPSGAVAASPAKAAAFAMRVRLLRRNSSGEFAGVAPNTRFRVGDEVVVVIEKNSGGLAAIRRAGSADPVPMAIETNLMARTVPLMVTGPMELSVTLTRSASAVRRLELPQQSTAQSTESADDMIYVAEPAGASSQALVARIVIRVE